MGCRISTCSSPAPTSDGYQGIDLVLDMLVRRRRSRGAIARPEHLRGRSVPMLRAGLESLLETDPSSAPGPTLPRSGQLVREELVRLGVLREALDDRVDLPELYLRAFGAKRHVPSREDVGTPA